MYGLASDTLLLGFLGEMSRGIIAFGYGSKPFIAESQNFAKGDVTYDRKYGIIGCVEAVVEGHDIGQCGMFNMLGAGAYCGPAVGMHLIGHGAYEVLDVTVGPIEVALLELFYNNTFLYLYALLCERESEHAIRL